LIITKPTYLPIIILIAAILCGLISCNTFDYKAEIPSYIEINAITHTTNSLQGSPHHNIKDVWVYVDDNAIGTYELPAKFPVLYGGSHEIKIRAGIKTDGFNTVRNEYQFYDFYTTTEKLIRGLSTEIIPDIKYFTGITFEMTEDFEIGSIFQPASASDTGIILKAMDTLSVLGDQSAVIYLDGDHSYFEIATNNEQYTLPYGSRVFLELTYACNNSFSVGLLKNTFNGSKKINTYITLYPTEGWNKIYINYTDYIKSHSDALSYELYFSGNKDAGNTLGAITLDNIKLIHD